MPAYKTKTKFGVAIAVALVIGVASGCADYRSGQGPQTELDEARVVALIEEQLEKRGLHTISDEELSRRVEQGIIAFVEKQRQAQARGAGQAEARARNLRPVSEEADYILGNPEARFSLIEYSDTECPYCKRFHATAHQLVKDYDGKVNWVYRHFPLASHNPGAQKQAEASECAAELGGNTAFWRYIDTIFERTTSGGTGFPVAQLVPLAAELGLDKQAFQACLESERHRDGVLADMRNGEAAGVTGTPGNFLVDHATGRVVPVAGAQPLQVLKQVVEQLSAQPKQ
jgi:protein-disulfide isomerase